MRSLMKNRRLQLRMTQQAAANLSGLTRANWSHIECGRREPSIEQMEAIAKALKVKPNLNFFKRDCDKMEQSG